jgi:signal peptidase I
LRAAIWAVIIITVWEFILTPIRVEGISMLPTYHDREINVINHLAYLRHEPQRGDVVAIRIIPDEASANHLPDGLKMPPHAVLLKRIVGLPGETVSFSGGHILINGTPLNELYETLQCDWNIPPTTLANDEYFVVGDNRTMSERDHTKGAYKRNQIIGRAVL